MRLGEAASAAWWLVFDGSASSAQVGFGIKRKSARRRARRNMMTQEKLEFLSAVLLVSKDAKRLAAFYPLEPGRGGYEVAGKL
jgi:hypothetical protein